MTFPTIGSERAPGIINSCPTAGPGTVPITATTIDLMALFGLDRLSADRRLVCRWAPAIDGLGCHWEPDIVAIPQR